MEQFVERKLHERRTLIAEFKWLDEPVYFMGYTNHMHTLSYDNLFLTLAQTRLLSGLVCIIPMFLTLDLLMSQPNKSTVVLVLVASKTNLELV